jgi:hypothetical protein
MPKRDFRKEFGEFYKAGAKQAVLVDVPKWKFLMVDGHGRPASAAFQGAVQTLFGLSYALKFRLKKASPAFDYAVMPLEGLYWCHAGDIAEVKDPEQLNWTLMILQPDFATRELFEETRAETGRKKASPELERVRLASFDEGRSVQMLHIGPYAEETRTMDQLRLFADEKGYTITGKHHEIYLNDPNRTAEAKLKTILRYGVKRGARSAAA